MSQLLQLELCKHTEREISSTHTGPDSSQNSQSKMAEAEKLSYLSHPIRPDDVTIKFISARWPDTEIIIN